MNTKKEINRQEKILNNLICYVLELKEHDTTEEKRKFFKNYIGMTESEMKKFEII